MKTCHIVISQLLCFISFLCPTYLFSSSLNFLSLCSLCNSLFPPPAPLFFFFSILSNPLLSFSCGTHLPCIDPCINIVLVGIKSESFKDKNKLMEKKSNTKTHSRRSLYFGWYSTKCTKIAETHQNGPEFV